MSHVLTRDGLGALVSSCHPNRGCTKPDLDNNPVALNRWAPRSNRLCASSQTLLHQLKSQAVLPQDIVAISDNARFVVNGAPDSPPDSS